MSGEGRSTERLRNKLPKDGTELANQVARVLEAVEAEGFNLPLLLDYISWGSPECYSHPKIRNARSVLLHSSLLVNVIERWRDPPRRPGSTEAKPAGAKGVLNPWIFTTARKIIEHEISIIAPSFRFAKENLTEERLINIRLTKLQATVKADAPHMWSLLRGIAWSDEQEETNTMKSPDLVNTFYAEIIGLPVY